MPKPVINHELDALLAEAGYSQTQAAFARQVNLHSRNSRGVELQYDGASVYWWLRGRSSDDTAFGAHILANMATQAVFLRQPAEAVRLARAAVEGARRAHPAVMARLYTAEACAHAIAADEASCSTALRVRPPGDQQGRHRAARSRRRVGAGATPGRSAPGGRSCSPTAFSGQGITDVPDPPTRRRRSNHGAQRRPVAGVR